ELVVFEEEPLARYYQEAVLLQHSKDSTYQFPVDNLEMKERLEAFFSRMNDFTSLTEEKNRMRREFGDTYWWYFFYQ
ncbi:MAG: DUF6057 family protein, partial [Phocaeicola sp.]